MIHSLSTSEFLQQSTGHLIIDVRSEAEFQHAHIPHAVNLPLLSNEERKVVGILYKQQGREQAMMKGLEIVGPKMQGFIAFAKEQIREGKVFIHCWRGGMRSGSMAWLFSMFGYEVYTLTGGYKAYRKVVLQKFGENLQLKVIGGYTGSGKTEVLQQLKNMGSQAVDLEALANHRGSAFGNIGLPRQPSAEMFENLLHHELNRLNSEQPIWIEDESRNIGTVYIQTDFWMQMRKASLYVLHLPEELRQAHLLSIYGDSDHGALRSALERIERRLGNEQFKKALTALEANDLREVTRIVLYYYDKTYGYGLQHKEAGSIHHFHFKKLDPAEIATVLVNAVSAPH